MNKQIINYSQCWEDPALLNEALEINSEDVVLSITSGGDNTLALLLERPQKVISLDLNPAQNYLLELKIAAIKALHYEELLNFIGARKSSHREKLFEKVENYLSREAASWWDKQRVYIKQGVIHVGRFERFLAFFRRYILPLTHSKKTIEAFLNSSSLQAQRDFFQHTWNSKRWRLFFYIVSSRFVLRNFARQYGMFTYAEPGAVAKEYLRRLDRNFNTIFLQDNYFMHYCLTGTYGRSMPPYLEEARIRDLKESFSQLSIVTDDLAHYLESMPDDSFSKFNVSDIFEGLSLEQNDSLWRQIVRTAKNGARLVYWNNLVPRSFPQYLSAYIRDENQLAQKLHLKDRVFFYGDFHIHTITK